MAKKDTGRQVVANNKKARHDYHILDTYEAGLSLMGTEVKSLRMGRASLVDGFVVAFVFHVALHLAGSGSPQPGHPHRTPTL